MCDSSELLTTPLHYLHLELGAKMGPFAGYQLPVQYPTGVIKEHLHTRKDAGLFDVSHMGQISLSGPQVASQLAAIVPVDVEALNNNQQSYAVLTNDNGGILDDLIICRWTEEKFLLVVNAACKERDLEHIKAHMGDDTRIELLEDLALIALQGPAAADVLASLAPGVAELDFMQGCFCNIDGMSCYVTRSGYTGEDGFEISIHERYAEAVARLLLEFSSVKPIGLGARDSLRLEAGLCLYGHDMDTHVTPVEASLQWSISKSRREGGSKEGGFPGSDIIFKQMKGGVSNKRVGLHVEGRMPIREGAILESLSGKMVGIVSSGGFAPSIREPIAMGYVNSELASTGTQLNAIVRGKAIPVTVAAMPFVPQRYFRG